MYCGLAHAGFVLETLSRLAYFLTRALAQRCWRLLCRCGVRPAERPRACSPRRANVMATGGAASGRTNPYAARVLWQTNQANARSRSWSRSSPSAPALASSCPTMCLARAFPLPTHLYECATPPCASLGLAPTPVLHVLLPLTRAVLQRVGQLLPQATRHGGGEHGRIVEVRRAHSMPCTSYSRSDGLALINLIEIICGCVHGYGGITFI